MAIESGIDTKIMNRPNINQLYLKDTSFANLMQKEFNVLLVASRYDAFYHGRRWVGGGTNLLNMFPDLSFASRVKQVTTNEETFEELA